MLCATKINRPVKRWNGRNVASHFTSTCILLSMCTARRDTLTLDTHPRTVPSPPLARCTIHVTDDMYQKHDYNYIFCQARDPTSLLTHEADLLPLTVISKSALIIASNLAISATKGIKSPLRLRYLSFMRSNCILLLRS